jgi:putative ABC transport system substrate-binding protein
LETPAAGSVCHAADMYRRATGYIAKILRGTKASDLPIERPINFEFAVNLKIATLLTRADEVIE